MTGEKRCGTCRVVKPAADFYKSRHESDGLQRKCIPCLKAYNFGYRRRPHAREAAKRRSLQRLAGASLEDRQQLIELQRGLCAICARTLDLGKLTHVDHCHTTGRLRGVLCQRCNVALGMLGDSVECVRRALAYLERAVEPLSDSGSI